MQPSDIFLALTCVLLWGANFFVIKLGLADLPPLLFASLRFGLVASLAFVFPRPKICFFWLTLFGIGWGAIQFGCLFLSIKLGMPSGISSVIVQSQVFFTLIFSALLCMERFELHKSIALIVAFLGISLFLLDGNESIPTVALCISLLGAAGWASGNILIKKLSNSGYRADTVNFIAWTSIIPAISLGILSLIFEDTNFSFLAEPHAILNISIGILYQVIGASIIGSIIWNRLLFKYPASVVAPFSLLVPVVGLSIGTVGLDEHLSIFQAFGSMLLLLALIIHLYWSSNR